MSHLLALAAHHSRQTGRVPSLAELADLAGVSRATVYRAFANQQGLVEQLQARGETVPDPGQDVFAAVRALILEHGGTLERFTGDGMMVFFNDPVPQPDHVARAVRMAVTMRERFANLAGRWAKLGFELGFVNLVEP